MIYWSKFLVPFLVSIGLFIFLIPALISMARRVGLVDHPGERKQHTGDVPLVGGIAIAISLSLAILLFPNSFSNFRILFFCIGILIITGVLDDQREINAVKKFIFQVTAALILVTMGDTTVTTVGDILAVDQPLGLSFLAVPFSLIAIVAAINAFNMIDGHDGLAASTAILTLAGLVFLLSIRGSIGDAQYALLIVLLTSLLIVFLFFNLGWLIGPKNKVFLGDAGSNLIGIVIAFLLIQLSQREVLVVAPAAAPWFIGLPLFDMVAVIVGRVVSRTSILAADRNHAHHLLKQLGLSDFSVLCILAVTQGMFVFIAICGTLLEWPDSVLFWGLAFSLIVYLLVLNLLRRKIDKQA